MLPAIVRSVDHHGPRGNLPSDGLLKGPPAPISALEKRSPACPEQCTAAPDNDHNRAVGLGAKPGLARHFAPVLASGRWLLALPRESGITLGSSGSAERLPAVAKLRSAIWGLTDARNG